MANKPKLELTWIGKENRPRLEPRILLEDPEKSYHAKHRVSKDDIFDNRLIFGDNLLALKALEQEFAGKVKCVYIDPPYNTGNAFEHYDDSVEHSIWLGLMRDRITVLRRLLSRDGFFCCHIDDSEGPYLKVMLDEIFGRENYLTTFYIQVRYPEKTLKQDMAFHKEIEQIHIYRKEYGAKPNQNISESSFDKFTFYVKEIGKGKNINLGGKEVTIFQNSEYSIYEDVGSEDGLKEIWATGTILDGNSSGRFFRDYLSGRVKEDGLGVLYKVKGIGDDKFDHRYFTGPKKATATKGKYFQGVPRDQLADPDQMKETPIENFYDLAGSFGNCRHEGNVEFRSGKKPEKLLEIIIRHFSNAGDLILDSFAGSGTTGAVAHKMGRRWIMVELGEHCHTHIIPRLKKVIDGEDKGGISLTPKINQSKIKLCPKCTENLCEVCFENINIISSGGDLIWKGGGGFRYYKLAPSLLEKDKYDNWIINKEYNAAMLAEAICKLEGFTYSPSDSIYWIHGKSTETDFIYVTTQNLSRDQLALLSDEVGGGRTLLVMCSAFRAKADSFPNLTIKKIPNTVLSKCEWSHDDYSLQVENLPSAPKPYVEQPSLFEEEEI